MQSKPSDFLTDGPYYDVKKHLLYVQELWRGYKYNTLEKCKPPLRLLLENCPNHLREIVAGFIADLFEDNEIFIIKEPTLEYAPYLKRMQARLTLDPDLAFPPVRKFLDMLYQNLPEAQSQFQLPFWQTIDHNEFIGFVNYCFYSEKVGDIHLFRDLYVQINRNMVEASGYDYDTYDGKGKITPAKDYKGTPDVVLMKYLKETPFLEILDIKCPFVIPRDTWKEHAAIFAPTGGGKTVTLQTLIIDFLKQPNPPAMFIMDSMGAMLKKIERLKIIPPEKLVILDPTDEKPPALNFFKLKAGSSAQQISLFFYLFKAIEQGLTQRQATMVAYLVELMQQIEGSTLDTLRQVCESKAFQHHHALDHLDPIARDFFTNQFMGKDPLINQTKQQIAQRLYTVGRNHTFNLMFNAPDNKFDAFKCMQEGKVVLINTDKYNLGEEASAIFGRFIIAQCLAAALARAPLPQTQRPLALLIVDEAKAYLDEQAQTILSDARQFGFGLILATQYPHQLTEGVQREIATNTSIKMMGDVAYSVASQFSRDMRTTPEFIKSMIPRPPHSVEFATFVRGLTPAAIKLSVPIGVLEAEPTTSEGDWRAMRRRNRALYGAEPPAPKMHTPPTPPAPPSPPDKPAAMHHQEVIVEQPQTTKKKPKQPQTSSPVTELDTDH